MKTQTSLLRRILAPATALALVATLVAPPAFGDPPDRDRWQRDGGRDGGRDRIERRRPPAPPRARGRIESRSRTQVERRDRRWRDVDRGYRHPVVRGHDIYVPMRHVWYYRHVLVVRPYGHRYRGYGFFVHDSDAFTWLALTAITLGILNYLSEHQQRTYEQAQIQATTAPVGETIHWNDGNASGSVKTLRDGTSSTGNYCREFQQTVTIGGRTEQAYGTACRQPDGAWQVVSSGQGG